MTMRITGLTSGLDTETIIQELTSAYSKKTEKYEKQQTKLSWKQDAWKSLNTKIYSLYTNVSNLRFSSAYATKKATVSDATKAKVSVSGNAVNGTHKLNVLSTAQTAYMTGGKLELTEAAKQSIKAQGGTAAVTEDTLLRELGFSGNATSFEVITKDEEGNDKTTTIDIDRGTSIKDVISKFKDAGVNASFDQKNGRIYVNASKSGADSDFQIRAVQNTITTTDDDGTEHKVKEYDAEGNPVDNIDSALALSTLGLYSEKIYLTESLTGSKLEAKNDDGSKASVTKETTLKALGLKDDASFNITTRGENGESATTAITLTADMTIEDVLKQLNDAGVSASFSEKNGLISISESKAADHGFWIDGSEDALKALGLSSALEEVKTNADKKVGVKIEGQDAKIKLDGMEYTNSTNEFSINGIDITAMSVTGDKDEDAITISVDTDTDSIYDAIKDFLTEYNNIINEITKLYNADSSYGYDPLTDDEKSAMSDNEIELWETKIKDSLLRRDSTLSGIMSTMINSMAQSYEINGTKYSLSSFGIATLGYLNAAKNEQYAYHIDGDEDDSNTSGNKDKLMTAIKNDPDSIIEFMKKLATGLYTAIDGKMKSTALSSAYTVYNDKEMNSQYSEYSKTISKWEDKASEKEDYYYKQFAAMEAAMAKLQSQTSSLTGLFG